MTPSEEPHRQRGTGRPEPIAIVGVGAIMPEAPSAGAFWANITGGRYCITDVPKDRWDPELYYDPDPRAPDKTYSRIGGWVRDFPWDPIGWRLALPPKVSDQMDDGQKWAVAAAREALTDAGWPNWNIDPERVAVIIGNALGGEKHYASNLRIQLPEFTRELTRSESFRALPPATRAAIVAEATRSFRGLFWDITEDTMPGELANIIAGRIANLFNFRGASFTTDAACASGLAALSAAAHELAAGQCDAVITGGVDRNMGPAAFVKFCKIGALSATGTRPFDAGADGFVMGEGAALFVLKRLADAERDGDRIYAVLLGIAGSSDGKGKGITAPNPAGQRLAIARAWANAGVDLASVSCVEAHGTSTRVGDATELESLISVFRPDEFAPASIALGSVKSNIGHLKAAAGTAGLFKQVMAVHEKVLPPSLGFREPNPNVDWAACPFRVNTELREWPTPACGVRRAGVSAFGFGGTNFHAVVEEYIPGLHDAAERRTFASAELPQARVSSPAAVSPAPGPVAAEPVALPEPGPRAGERSVHVKAPLRGALVVGGDSETDVAAQLARVRDRAAAGEAPASATAPPDPALAAASVRVAIDFGTAAELAEKAGKAVDALTSPVPELRRMLRPRGVFIGHGPAPRTAFLYTGQGSQYVNMLRELRETEPIVAQTFAEADEVMTPLLGKPLTDYVFADSDDPEQVARAEGRLLQTEITQPAVLATDMALTRLLGLYGVEPDMVMGHSLGEYGALVAAGAMSFGAALEAVSARGREMASISVPDKGAMAAVMAPLDEIERIVASVDGYVVIANINSTRQAVIGGATDAVERAISAFMTAGHAALRIPVSHAFHTTIVAPASEPLRRTLARLDLRAPAIPIVANVDGQFYPSGGPGVTEQMLDILGRQVASPVQFVKGLRTLYDAGARLFVEVGPKRALQGFAEDVLGRAHEDVLTLFTNHPKNGDITSFNAALCGLYAAGLAFPAQHAVEPSTARASASIQPSAGQLPAAGPRAADTAAITPVSSPGDHVSDERRYAELGRLVVDLIDRSRSLTVAAQAVSAAGPEATAAANRDTAFPSPEESVVITGAALGLPGTDRVFDDENVARILSGEQFIDVIPRHVRREMVDKHITRLVKSDTSDPVFETIDSEADVIKLAGRYGSLDLVAEFGVDADRDAALDQCTRLAIGAGLDALRDAGIPLVQHYRTTTLGTKLPDRWGLPDRMRDDTGVVFASAFPGLDAFADDLNAYHEDQARRHELSVLEDVRDRMSAQDPARTDVDRRIADLQHWLEAHAFTFNRRFLFRILSMGHSQFAELIGARGPNTQVNSACASTLQAICLAEDWIRAGRCRRVVVVSADNAASDAMLPWTGSGFLASGAAATDGVVEDAVLPFDRRRHGMIVGSGAAALVVESAESARARSIRPICEIVATVSANSAFHGTRLDTEHISQVMDQLVRKAEGRGIQWRTIADQTVFVSHETYTPARGGSSSAEIAALRHVFGAAADSIVIANTKGYTGHAMGAGIEEVVAVKALETGIVPPVPNVREPDPELGQLNLSRGGSYPVKYALRLAAGFGSQIAMALLHWVEPPDGAHRAPSELGYGYRIADEPAWRSWLAGLTGHDDSRLEVVQRRLRVADGIAPARAVTAAAAEAANGNGSQPRFSAPAPIGSTAVDGPMAPAAAAVSVAQVRSALPSGTSAAESATRAQPTGATAPTATAPPAGAQAFAATPASVPPVSEAPAATESAPSPEVAPVAEPAGDPVAGAVLDVVEKLTGYPRDLLDLDLDLEADLGVDTVKQAEVFAAVRERFGIARQDSLRLRDYPTLSHVIGFVHQHAELPHPAGEAGLAAEAPPAAGVGSAAVSASAAAQSAQAPESAQAAQSAPVAEPAADLVAGAVLDVVESLTGYPRDLLDLDLDLEADLGVDTVKQAEVFAAVRERFGIPRQDSLRLRDYPTLAHVIGFVHQHAALSEPAAAGAPAAESAPAAEFAPADEFAPTVGSAHPAESAQASAAASAGVSSQAPSVAPTAEPAADLVAGAVLEVVESLTGYPRDLLDLDLDLEADLGVDTVKQAEVFAAVRERFGIPRQDSLRLRDYPTLAHVIGFVHQHAAPSQPAAADTAAATQAPASPQTPEPAEAAAAVPQALAGVAPAFTGDMSAAERLARRVPVPVLRPPSRWCKPTGVILDQTRRVVVMADEGGVAAALVRRLRALGVGTLVLAPGCATADIESRLTEWLADGPVHGIYWLASLDSEPPISELDLAGWHEALGRRVKNLYAVVRRLDTEGQLGSAGTFLVAATRMGGFHGYDEAGATSPLGGSVTGFTKAYARERPDVLAKAVDFPATRKTAALADALIEETLSDPGAVEIGRADGRRWTVGLREMPFSDKADGMALGSQTVFAVTGAAGAIVSSIVADVAQASGGVFHLLDLTPEPEPGDPDLIQFATDREGLRKKITERLADGGTRPTPVLIERELARYERSYSALIAIHAVRAAGGEAHYHEVDLTDPEAVAGVMADIRGRHGHLDVLVHAAGLEISRSIADKEQREFDLVFDVKSDGLFNLLHAAADMPLAAVVAFSSVAGRFGNTGQTDYSAANDLECKIMSSFRTTRPGTRGIAIDWTAWAGLGMATRGSVPKMMAMAGIEMLEPQAGIPWIRRELTAGPFSGEVVVGGQLGLLMAELDVTGGLDLAAIGTSSAGPMIGTITGMGVYSGLTAETTLDPAEQPFLRDHRIDSVPVLPGVMGIEAFAALARLAVPDLQVASVEQVDFLAPVKFYRDAPRTVMISAVIRRAGADLVADCTLSATRMIASEETPRVTTHFTGQVRLAPGETSDSETGAERGEAPGAPAAVAVGHDDVYRVFFHGPAYQVVDQAWHHGSDAVSRLARDLPAACAPATGRTTTEPRLAEACFQTAGLWEIGSTGHLALPGHVDQVSMLHRPLPDSELFATAHQADDGSFDCQVVDGDGDVVVRVRGYRTSGLDDPLPAGLQKPIHDAMSA